MKTLITLVAGLTLAAAVVWAVVSFRSERAARRAAGALATENVALERRVAALEKVAEDTGTAAAGVEKDNTSLRTAIDSALAARAARDSKSPEVVTRQMVDTRYARGKALSRSGDVQGALKEFLWCYKEGMPRVAGMGGVRQSYLLEEILRLGAEGEAAIRALRDEARAAILAGGSDRILDFGALSDALKDDQAAVQLYDSLPAGDRRRQALAISAFNQFLTAKRYADAITGRSYRSMISAVELNMNSGANPRLREYGITSTARNIEALAGAGELDSAKTLIARLLSYDSSDATKARIQEHLTRAGHPELLGGEQTR